MKRFLVAGLGGVVAALLLGFLYMGVDTAPAPVQVVHKTLPLERFKSTNPAPAVAAPPVPPGPPPVMATPVQPSQGASH